jgi:hypothetical protein
MSQNSHVIRRGVLLSTLALGASLALAACGGGGGSPGDTVGSTAANAQVGGSDNSQCAAAEKDYTAFLANKPAPSGENNWDVLSSALGNVVGSSAADLTPLGMTIFQVEDDADNISSDISQGGAGAQDYEQFDTDLQSLAKACGTTLPSLPKSITG